MSLKHRNNSQTSLVFLLLALGLLILSAVFLSSTYFRAIFVTGISIFIFWIYQRSVSTIKKAFSETEKEIKKTERTRIESLEESLNEQKEISKNIAKNKEKFREAAFHNKLTNLPNRNYVLDTLESLLSINKENPDYTFGILYLDLNNFKNINTSLGHSFGDDLLILVANRLKECVDDSSILAHFGSDEFAIVLTDVTNKATVVNLADRIATKIALPFGFQDREIFTSVAMGVVYSRNVYENVEDILRDADVAMYRAKREQRQYVVFDRSMHDTVYERLQMETDLRRAIERNEFHLLYQPLVDLKSLKLVGFESLIRWDHPTKGVQMPNDFIPVAEDTGLIVAMTEWSLFESCRQLKIWQEKFDQDLFVSVNLSRKHLSHPMLLKHVQQALEENDYNPSKLKIEITEGAVMDDSEKAIVILEKIKSFGIQLSFDDFGTGYSSLSYLHKFPINTIKIDRSFVNIIEEAGSNDEMVRTIISMAKSLNLDVIAEGIEKLDQFKTLKDLNCEYGQGYLFSRPLSEQTITELLRDEQTWERLATPDEENFLPPNSSFNNENLSIG